tara:strand:+ start:2099 stop:2434 length:336 start_codon:yes stop_codon:yes gene_type:complete
MEGLQMDTGSSWEAYSKMVLKQLEDLSVSMNGLRQEIQELKSEIAEIRGQQSNVQDLKVWKDKIDEICSPTQLRQLKTDMDELKMFKVKAITIFAVVQFAMAAAMFIKNFI